VLVTYTVLSACEVSPRENRRGDGAGARARPLARPPARPPAQPPARSPARTLARPLARLPARPIARTSACPYAQPPARPPAESFLEVPTLLVRVTLAIIFPRHLCFGSPVLPSCDCQLPQQDFTIMDFPSGLCHWNWIWNGRFPLLVYIYKSKNTFFHNCRPNKKLQPDSPDGECG
jgi:hypothetical protein